MMRSDPAEANVPHSRVAGVTVPPPRPAGANRPKRGGTQPPPPPRAVVYERDQYLCRYCGRRVHVGRRLPGRLAASIDHVIPLCFYKGIRPRPAFAGSLDNLVTACEPCNNRKADRTPEQAGMPLLPVPL